MYALVVIAVLGLLDTGHAAQVALLAAATYMMTVLNSRHSLIRVFSRLVSSAFLALTLTMPSLLDSLWGGVSCLLFVTALVVLFGSYQNHHATGTTFLVFACLGVISLDFIQVAVYVPVLWLMMFTHLQAGSPKVLVASLLGLLLPYWFWFCYSLYDGNPMAIVDHVAVIAQTGNVAEGLFATKLLLPLLLIATLGTAGCVHFISESHADSIKTRMFYNTLMTLFVFTLLLIVLQPQHSDRLMRLLLVCAAPLVAHLFTFANSWMANIAFVGTIAATLTLTILNGWIF